MEKILIIARHEFLCVVTRKAYIISLITLPLALGLIFSVLQARSAGEVVALSKGTVGVIDQIGLIDLDGNTLRLDKQSQSESLPSIQPKDLMFKRYEKVKDGLQDLQSSKLDILYVIEPKYLQSGEIEIYGRDTRHLRGSSPTGYSQLSMHLRAGLLRRLLPGDSAQEKMASDSASSLIDAPILKKLSVEDDGTVGPMRSSWERLSAVLAPLSVAFLLGLSVFLSSATLLEATVEEGKNRVMEILLSSVKEDQLTWGKLLGLAAAGLLQIVFYLALVSLAAIYLWVGVDIQPADLLWYFIYWMLGHLLYAGLLLATGILLSGHQESNQFTSIWLFIGFVPLYFTETLFNAPNGWFARTLSYIPFTSPVAMVFRLAKTNVPAIDLVISLALLLASIWLVVHVTGKILRTGSLMYGKQFTLPEVMRWLREA